MISPEDCAVFVDLDGYVQMRCIRCLGYWRVECDPVDAVPLAVLMLSAEQHVCGDQVGRCGECTMPKACWGEMCCLRAESKEW